MGLRDKINAASAARAKGRRKLVTLPDGLEVELRGMMAGEQLRLGETQNEHGAGRAMPLAIALCAFEPGGAQVWNPNHGPDLLEIAALDPETFDPLRDAALEVSGLSASTDPLRAAVEALRKEAADETRGEAVRAEVVKALAILDGVLGEGAEGNASSAPTKSGSSSSPASSEAAPRRSGAKR